MYAGTHLGAYSEKTRNIIVTIEPEFLHAESDIEQGVYAFAYTVSVENTGDEPVQLLNRHWLVFSGGRQIADVKGEGILGEQPHLRPGRVYEYTSWTVIRDPVGAMRGSYTFCTDSGEFFDVAIPRFDLVYFGEPRVLH